MAEIVDFGLQQHKIKMDSRYFENVLSVVAGDTGRRIEVQLLDTNGMVQNTTGLSLRLNAEIAGKATYTDATLVDAATGKYQLDLSNGMFLAPGNWQFQWQITDSAGKKLHSFAFTGNIGSNISEGGSQATNFYFNMEELQTRLDEVKEMQNDLETGVVSAIPPNESITMQKLAITKKSTNLYDESSTTKGFYVDAYTGNLIVGASFQVSDFIPIEPNKAYVVARLRHIAYYDKDKKRVSGNTVAGTDLVFTSHASGLYMRFSWENPSAITQQVNEGSVKLPYEPYYNVIDSKYVERTEVLPSDIKDESLSYKKTNFVQLGKNLFDNTKASIGYYVAWSNGQVLSNAGYNVTNFIEVKPITSYTLNYHYMTAFYDEYKTYISGVSGLQASGKTIVTPERTKYMITTLIPSMMGSFQIEEGTSTTTYEPYGYVIPRMISKNGEVTKDEVVVFLPSEICIAVGRTIELYNNQVVWAGNLDNYHIQWVSSIGKSYKRKWSFTGATANIGNYDLTINVFDNNLKQVATAKTVVKVVDDSLLNTYNILNIGDSLTNGKPWLNELSVLSSNKLIPIGTRQGKHEGRSGHTANWYLGNNTYTFDTNYDGSNPNTDGKENPFWNPTTSKFDLSYYKTSYNKNPNAVQLFLGTNGIAIDPTSNAVSIKNIVDAIRISDSTIPIFVVFTLYRGDQNGIGKQASNDGYSAERGQWKLEEDRKVFNLMVRLNELLKSYTNLHFVPIALSHDSQYNFGQVATLVNPRSAVTEPQPSEATHPQTEGYMQMADIMFSTMVAHLE